MSLQKTYNKKTKVYIGWNVILLPMKTGTIVEIFRGKISEIRKHQIILNYPDFSVELIHSDDVISLSFYKLL